MMGSLLIVNGGELAFPLPVGVPCEMLKMGGGGQKEIDAINDQINQLAFRSAPQVPL